MSLSSSSLGSAFTYTPDITLDLYTSVADAAAQTGAIGSAVANNVNFTNDGVVDPSVGYNYEDEQLVTFDFTSQNITIPSTFVFAYHDAAPLDSNGTGIGAGGLSVGLTTEPATIGTAPLELFSTYPNGTPTTKVDNFDGYGIERQKSARCPL